MLSKGEPGHLSCSTKKILHAGLILMLEDRFKIDDTTTNFRKTLIGFLRHIFYMPERKTTRMFLEQGQRILTCFFDPVQVNFHFHQILVGFFQQNVIGEYAILILKFKVVVMIAELDSRFFACLCRLY